MANKRKPTHRKHHKMHDYKSWCIYHITLVVSDRVPLFGRIVGETVDEARDYVYELQKICKRIRKKCNPNIEQCNRWDMPRVVSACGTPGRDVICREGCGQTIRKKNCHKKLYDVLPGALDSNFPPKGAHIPGLGFRVDHCAEPHAANVLLKETNCIVSEIVFSTALGTDDGSPRIPCITCKATFKQLR